MSLFNLTDGELARIAKWKPQDYTSQSVGREVPVTPSVHHTGQTEYFENRPTTSSDKKPFDPAGATPGPRWNPNQYDDATEKSAGVALIRRLAKASLSGTTKEKDPVEQYPSLSLTGRIISATFNVPYSIGLTHDGKWVSFQPASHLSLLVLILLQDLQPRRGTSALFDSLSYLASSSSPWSHTLVGWTGEIAPVNKALNGNQLAVPLNKLSQPIVEPGMQQPEFIDPNAPLRITKAERQRLEKQLEYDHGGKIVPVWLGEKAKDAKAEEEDAWMISDQGRWRKYARKELYTREHRAPNWAS